MTVMTVNDNVVDSDVNDYETASHCRRSPNTAPSGYCHCTHHCHFL